MRSSDWSSDVCSSDLHGETRRLERIAGLVLRDLGSGRLEVRAPDHLPGISGDLAHYINRLAQQYAELRSGVDARIAEQTARLKRERDQVAAQRQERSEEHTYDLQ